jgi:TonB family protein
MSNLPLQIEIHADGKLIETRRVTNDVIKIGRLASSHIQLDDADVARMHAVLEVSGGDVRLVDLGSPAGTRVNGARVDKHVAVRSGDRIDVGAYTLAVSYQRAPVANAMAQRPAMAAGAAHPMTSAPSPEFAPVAAAVASRPWPTNAADVERSDGTAVAEIITSYGDTVLDVRHIGTSATRRRVAPWLLGAGALMTVAGAGLFASDVMADWDGYREQVTTAQEEGRAMPEEPGTGFGTFGAILALLGLVPMMHGVSRRETVVASDYTIGEASDASFAMPCDAFAGDKFALVRTIDGAQHLSFTAQMSGVVQEGNTHASLEDLVASGRATRRAGRFDVPIASGARCRLQAGAITFHVNAVAPGKVIAGRAEVDKPFWAYTGSSLAVLGGLLVLTQLIPDGEMEMNLDDIGADNRYVGYLQQPDEEPEPELTDEVEPEVEEEAGGQGERASGPEGKMGDPREKTRDRAYALKKRPGMPPAVDRNYSMDASARTAGILGMMEESSSSFLADANGTFASGESDEDVWGNMNGGEIGSAFGMAGKGLVGSGRGGGGDGQGIGLGDVGLIGWGGGGGDGRQYGRGPGLNYGRDKGTALTKRTRRVPTARVAKGEINGALDKDVIRRVVRSHINEVRHCYNAGLTRDPNLSGRVQVQFQIGATGRVSAAVPTANGTTLGDKAVERCVAQAVRRWKFPRASNGGTSMVSYPFVFSPG